MKTPYTAIYERFLSKIKDYPLLDMIEKDSDFAKKMLYGYMVSATAHFTYSNKDLSNRNEDEECFNTSLTALEIEILSMFMIYTYLSQHVVTTEKITEKLSSKDFRTYSPANLLKEVREIQMSNYDRAVQLMVENYYRSWHE